MSRPTVYLAGPITGNTHDECNDWREAAIQLLNDSGINGLSPMRCKEYLKAYGVLAKQYMDCDPLSSNKGIVTRDRMDATGCDVMFAYFPASTNQVSIGTCIEFGWADAHQIPIVMVAEGDPNIDLHDHGMLNHMAGFKVNNFDEGIDIVVSLLNAYAN